MIIAKRVYFLAGLYLIAFGGFLAGLACFQFLPAGVTLAAGALLVLSVLAFVGGAIGLARAFRS